MKKENKIDNVINEVLESKRLKQFLPLVLQIGALILSCFPIIAIVDQMFSPPLEGILVLGYFAFIGIYIFSLIKKKFTKI